MADRVRSRSSAAETKRERQRSRAAGPRNVARRNRELTVRIDWNARSSSGIGQHLQGIVRRRQRRNDAHTLEYCEEAHPRRPLPLS